jgi:hypothetical protein
MQSVNERIIRSVLIIRRQRILAREHKGGKVF